MFIFFDLHNLLYGVLILYTYFIIKKKSNIIHIIDLH